MGYDSEKTILLVEEAPGATSRASILRKHGFEVLTLHSGEEAIAQATEEKIDLVLMDINLGKGKMDGPEAAEGILQYNDLPVVFLYARTNPEIIEKAEKIASYGYLEKSCGETVLIATIKTAFRLHDAHMQLKKEKREKWFQAKLLEAVEQSIITTDLDGTITYWNWYAEKLYGWEEAEVIGKNIRNVTVPEMSLRQAEEIMDRLSKGKSWAGDFYVQRKGGERFFAHVTNSPVFNDQGEMSGIIGISFDCTKRKKAEETFRNLFENMVQGVVYLDGDGKIIMANEATARILGISSDQIKGLTSADPHWHTIREDGSPFPAEALPAVIALRTGEIVEQQVMGVFHPGKKEHVWLNASAVPEFRPGESEPYRVFTTFEDITENKKKTEAFNEQGRFLNAVFNSIQDFISVQDRDLRITKVNHMVEQMYPDNVPLEGQICYEVYHNREKPCENCPSLRAFESKQVEMDIISVGKEGQNIRWFELFAYPIISAGGEVVQIVEYARDITDRKKSEDRIQDLLQEKDILLREVNHRVKNNINIIASLLSLQANTVESEDGRAALMETRNRVISMQKLYTHLFRSDNHAKINVGAYLSDLLQEIVRTYSEDTSTIYSNLDDIILEVKKAVPLGIIINELVVNSIKYAFPEGKKGNIEITLQEKENDTVELRVKDNGIGIPDETREEQSKGFGLNLVHTLVSQIKGTLDFDSFAGTTYEIRFPR